MIVNRKRSRIGDVMEIKTARGLSYFQYTHRIEQWGALIRIFITNYNKRPNDFVPIVADAVQFTVFFPLSAACNRGLVQLVANENIRPELQPFPSFKVPGFTDRSGNIHNWFLWDGKTERRIENITEDFLALPIREVINDTSLIERIETNRKLSNPKG